MPRQYRTNSASRERNRVHAQRTRQRKKEQMLTLQKRATELKEEQIRLKQVINDKSTATILVHLFAEGSNDASQMDDPDVEVILKRKNDEIPDAAKIPELPALILPGQHASKKMKASAKQTLSGQQELPNDGIDYELLGRDRSQCTPEELDRIRRERNRMHAKRTRDRKRLFTEKMAEICRQLEDENTLLNKHLQKLDPNHKFEQPARVGTKRSERPAALIHFDKKISALLEAASQTETFHEVSDNSSAGDEESVTKRRRTVDCASPPITATEAPTEPKHGFRLGPIQPALSIGGNTTSDKTTLPKRGKFHIQCSFSNDTTKSSASSNLVSPANSRSPITTVLSAKQKLSVNSLDRLADVILSPALQAKKRKREPGKCAE